MNKTILLFLFLIPFVACSQTNCNNLPKTFNSYDQALYEVKSAKFSYVDKVNTVGSSFVTGASYYSCDGQYGFLIIGLNNRQYIHKDLPIKVWLSFKSASSFGTFYNQNIRNKYRLTLQK